MPTFRAFLASSALLLVAACGSKGPKPVNPDDVKGPGDLGGVPVTPPGIPGVSYINLSCQPATVDCNGQPFEMHVIGDKPGGCRITQAGGVSIQINNKTDPSQYVTISLDGYQGSGRYMLDDPQSRKLSISQSLSLKSWGPENATCTNGSWGHDPVVTGTHVVSAPDPSCGATQCQVQIDEDDPTASPRKIKGHVSCSETCVNNDNVVCHSIGGGSIEFDFVANDCTN
jgi:hypothetical protein